jgi:hypothetical protein
VTDIRSKNSKYADFEGLREQAIALRREGLSRRQLRDRLFVDNNDILNRLPEGEQAPEWTKRPNAKDDPRAKARELGRGDQEQAPPPAGASSFRPQ